MKTKDAQSLNLYVNPWCIWLYSSPRFQKGIFGIIERGDLVIKVCDCCLEFPHLNLSGEWVNLSSIFFHSIPPLHMMSMNLSPPILSMPDPAAMEYTSPFPSNWSSSWSYGGLVPWGFVWTGEKERGTIAEVLTRRRRWWWWWWRRRRWGW